MALQPAGRAGCRRVTCGVAPAGGTGAGGLAAAVRRQRHRYGFRGRLRVSRGLRPGVHPRLQPDAPQPADLPRSRDEHWLPAPNGIHFHPPTSSIEGGEHPPRGTGDPASLLARHGVAAPRWLAAVRDIARRGAWGDRLVDALCDPPQTFVLGSVIAHVITFSAHRRQILRHWLREAGSPVDTGDPNCRCRRWLPTASSPASGTPSSATARVSGDSGRGDDGGAEDEGDAGADAGGERAYRDLAEGMAMKEPTAS